MNKKSQPMKDPLLEKLAEAFADGRSFDGYFLQENNVSAEDCWALSNRLAVILRGYLRAPAQIQYALLLAGADDESTLPAEIIFKQAAQQMGRDELNGHLDKLKNAR